MPDLSPQQTFQLAVQNIQSGRPAEALPLLQKLFDHNPSHPDIARFLGICLFMLGRQEEAIAAFRHGVAVAPNSAAAHDALATALHQMGRFKEAVETLQKGQMLDPTNKEILLHLGVSLRMAGELTDAAFTLIRLLQLYPDHPHGHASLGNVYREQGRLDDAVAEYRKSVEILPQYAEAHGNLGVVLAQLGNFEEALPAFRRAIALPRSGPGVHSNYIFTLPFVPSETQRGIYEELVRWNERYGEPVKGSIKPHENSRDAGRRLKVGYVSPDFRQHCQSNFTIPLFENHDHGAFEIHMYSSVARPDALTERIKKTADRWHEVAALSNERLAQKIREDGIDILVDLTMHMANNRMPVFAMKPAPIQVAWLAYPGSTGLSTMDYRFSDPHLDPPGMFDGCYSEKTHLLADTFWCYTPLIEMAVAPLPALGKGYITFGCLNNFCKLNGGVVELWSRVMREVPTSRLILLCPEGEARHRVAGQFGEQGVHLSRIEFVAQLPREEYFKTYQRIDIALDTFPSNGHTTSLDGLWMGVPVVTLVSDKLIGGRAGVSQLRNLKLEEFIAETPEQFVSIATRWANDLEAVSALRCSLREKMEASCVMDGAGFTGQVESAYRRFWKIYGDS